MSKVLLWFVIAETDVSHEISHSEYSMFRYRFEESISQTQAWGSTANLLRSLDLNPHITSFYSQLTFTPQGVYFYQL